MDYTLYIYLFIHIVQVKRWPTERSDKGYLPHPERLLFLLPSCISFLNLFSFYLWNHFPNLSAISHCGLQDICCYLKRPWVLLQYDTKKRKRDWLKNGSCLFDTLMLRTDWQSRWNDNSSDRMPQKRRLYVHKCQWACVRKCAAVWKQPFLEQTLCRLLSIELGCATVEHTLCCWPL